MLGCSQLLLLALTLLLLTVTVCCFFALSCYCLLHPPGLSGRLHRRALPAPPGDARIRLRLGVPAGRSGGLGRRRIRRTPVPVRGDRLARARGLPQAGHKRELFSIDLTLIPCNIYYQCCQLAFFNARFHKTGILKNIWRQDFEFF